MATETLRPNAAGDEETLPIVHGDGVGTHYTCVDEAIPDDTTTYVASNTDPAYARDLYNIADHSVGSGTISFIKVYARCFISPAPEQASLKIAIKSGTGSGNPDTVDESTEKTLTAGTWTNESNQWNTNPATATAWTWDEIDKLQAGIALRDCGAPAASVCTQVYVEVDYTPAVTHYGAATLSGVGTLASIGSFLLYGVATLSGTGSLSAIGGFLHTASATLSGVGSLTAKAKSIFIAPTVSNTSVRASYDKRRELAIRWGRQGIDTEREYFT